MLEFLFWFFVGPAALAAVLSIRSGRRLQDYVEGEILGESDPDEAVYRPPLTVILPVKGLDHELASNLRALAEQDYPDFEILVVCRAEDDLAVPVVQMTLGDRCRLIVAGDPQVLEDGTITGEKVHNLLAAVAAARPESEVLVFTDSDGRPAQGWLSHLVQPLSDETIGATTGFRWHFPESGRFWPLMRSAWDSTILGSMRDDGKNFAWGGAMALRRATFERARVAEFWRGSVSDDYRLTHAMEAADLPVKFVPQAMTATVGDCSREEFLEWSVRQMIITKVYRRKLWTAGLIAHIVYCGAMVAAVAATLSGNLLGIGALVVTQTPGMAKGAVRGYLGRLIFPEREEWFDQFGSIYFWYTPLATWFWLYAFVSSARTSVIEWRGNVYRLDGPNRTRKLQMG